MQQMQIIAPYCEDGHLPSSLLVRIASLQSKLVPSVLRPEYRGTLRSSLLWLHEGGCPLPPSEQWPELLLAVRFSI